MDSSRINSRRERYGGKRFGGEVRAGSEIGTRAPHRMASSMTRKWAMKLAAVDAVGTSSERVKGNRMSHVAVNAGVVRVVAVVVLSGAVA